MLQSSVPLGVVLGYGITAILDSEFGFWKASYYLQALTYFFLLIILFFIPSTYLEDSEEKEKEGESPEEKPLKPKEGAKPNSNSSSSESSGSGDEDGYASEDSSMQ